MKCITEYKKKVNELNDQYHKRFTTDDKYEARKAFVEYHEKLNELSRKLIVKIQAEKKIAIFTSAYL